MSSKAILSSFCQKHVSIVTKSNFYRNPYPDSKVHGANMGPTWVLSALDGPHVGPMNLAIRVDAIDTDVRCYSHGKLFLYFDAEFRWIILALNDII